MHPKLVAIAGSHQGTIFELTGEEGSIGREPSNWIALNDFSASRRHCLIRKEEDHFRITDLDSLNGTLLNDIPIQTRVLIHGDRITIGDSLFLFLVEESETQESRTAALKEDASLPRKTLRLRMEDGHYLHPQKRPGSLSAERVMQDFGTLMKISTMVNSIRGLAALQRKLLDLIFEIIPAERGAILLLTRMVRDSCADMPVIDCRD